MNVLKDKKILKIVVTGPESTGKTVMAEALAAALNTLWVPEFARYYLAHIGRPYIHSDLRPIGRGQKTWEERYAKLLQINPPAPPVSQSVSQSSEHAVLVCDTDWTVLQIWEQYRFQQNSDFEWRKGYGRAQNADFYLLCAPDFPWQPDPLREHPEERDTLYIMFENLLLRQDANFITLRGEHQTRLRNALAAIQQFF